MGNFRTPHPAKRGTVWTVDDSKLILRPDNDKRVPHNSRFVIVVSTDRKNLEDSFPIVLICPMSTSERARYKTQYDVPVTRGDGGTERDSYIRTTLVQSVDKSFLKHFKGVISTEKLESLQEALMDYMGMFDDEEDDKDGSVIKLEDFQPIRDIPKPGDFRSP